MKLLEQYDMHEFVYLIHFYMFIDKIFNKNTSIN